MSPDQPQEPVTIATKPLEPAADANYVGYSCGEHGFSVETIDPMRLRGDRLPNDPNLDGSPCGDAWSDMPRSGFYGGCEEACTGICEGAQ